MSTNSSPAGGARPSQLIDLALQGGGSHGAFTWGVLDRLLEESWLTIEAISGTSGRRHECRRDADGHAKGGKPGGARGARGFLAYGLAGRPVQPVCSAARSTSCSAAGRSTLRPPTSPST